MQNQMLDLALGVEPEYDAEPDRNIEPNSSVVSLVELSRKVHCIDVQRDCQSFDSSVGPSCVVD